MNWLLLRASRSEILNCLAFRLVCTVTESDFGGKMTKNEKEREIEERKKMMVELTEKKHEIATSDPDMPFRGFHVLVETTAKSPTDTNRFKTFVWFEPTADMLQDSELRIELCSMSRIATFGDGVSFVEMPDRFNIAVWGRDGALTLASAMRDAADSLEAQFRPATDEIQPKPPAKKMGIRVF